MKKILLLFLFWPVLSQAQFSESFSDGNFNQNPIWEGDTSEFQISTYSNSAWSVQPRLQLNGPQADTSVIVVPVSNSGLNNKQWDFWIRLAFNTSKTNNCRVYLASDSPNLKGSLQGFYLQFGDDVSDQQDSVSLWYQNGTIVQKIISGHTTFTGASANYRVKVKRDVSGNWFVFLDGTGGYNYQMEGSGFNTNTVNMNFFGFYCKYTSSNKTNFYFDDIYVGPIIVDTVKPKIVSVSAISSTEIEIVFSETVSLTSAESTANYNLAGIGTALTAMRNTTNPALIMLTYPALVEGTSYNLQVSSVEDMAANVMNDTIVPVVYYNAQAFDIVINEIMADPDPTVGLPQAEYLELYNRSSYAIPLKNWSIQIGSSTQTFPNKTIEPGGYLILTHNNNVSLLNTYGNIQGFGSFSITNSGTSISINNASGTVVHYVSFTDDWYRDNVKKDGGWSLEQMDVNNPCGEAANWKASIHSTGGTPGVINAVNNANPDIIIPQITNVKINSPTQLELLFSEILVQPLPLNPNSFFIDNSIGVPTSAILLPPENKKVLLELPNAIAPDILYTLSYTDTVFDCVGNYIVPISKTFAMYTEKTYDILITEIMADPEPLVGLPNAEYLELYNTSSFPISLSGWKLKIGSYTKYFNDVTIEPHDYLIVTGSGNQTVLTSYGKVTELESFSLSNTGDILCLINKNHQAISFVQYYDNWHSNALKKEGGWSLERIDLNNPCGENNWKSSTDSKGGTPGVANAITGVNIDSSSPKLIRASVNKYQPDRVRIYFNEDLDSIQMKQLHSYSVDKGIGNPYLVSLSYPDNRMAMLYFTSPLEAGTLYYVSISDSVFDCAGNKIMAQSKVRCAIPVFSDSADIVINEVLFNPKDNGVDYIELYNRSQKVLDLTDNFLANETEFKRITTDNYLLFPGDYVVLSTNDNMVKSQYTTPNTYAFINMESFPSFSNEEGKVVLYAFSDTIVDAMNYDASMHFPLLTTEEGVSLERIDFNREPSDVTNWHSAAETHGFGTPAYKNSQFFQGVSDDAIVSLSPEIFSPDNDGYNDILNIYCKTETPGKICNIRIYDAKGRFIKNLIKGKYIADDYTFTWDGTNENNQKATIGFYIVFVELIDVNGKTSHHKKTTVLGAKF